MANSIPCPNPVCTHQVSQAELQSAAQFVCPKCGFRMQGKKPLPSKPTAPPPAPAATAPIASKPPVAQPVLSPAAPSASPAASVPVAAPVQGIGSEDPPLATVSEGSVADGMYFNPGVTDEAGALVRPVGAKRKFSWLRLFLVAFAIGFAACIVIVAFGIIFLLIMGGGVFSGGDDPDGVIHFGSLRDSKGVNEKVYKLVLPKEEWVADGETLKRFAAHAAFKQRKGDCWFALVVKDFGAQRPRDAELMRMGVDRLENHYVDGLMLKKMSEPVKVGPAAQRLDALKLQFQGQRDKHANWIGECFVFFHNGVGYWLYIASTDWEDVSERFGPDLVDRYLSVLSERRGWREQPPPMENFATSGAKIEITLPKGVWERYPPKDEDERGELFLSGRFQRDKEKDNRKNATLLIFTLDKKADLNDAVKATKEHLDKKLKDENENYRLVNADLGVGSGESATVDVGDRRGRILDLKRTMDGEAQRYLLVAVISDPDVCYVVRGECNWDSRQIWRQEFLDALRSLRIKKSD